MLSARIRREGDLELGGVVSERSPSNNNHLLMHYPFDGSLNPGNLSFFWDRIEVSERDTYIATSLNNYKLKGYKAYISATITTETWDNVEGKISIGARSKTNPVHSHDLNKGVLNTTLSTSNKKPTYIEGFIEIPDIPSYEKSELWFHVERHHADSNTGKYKVIFENVSITVIPNENSIFSGNIDINNDGLYCIEKCENLYKNADFKDGFNGWHMSSEGIYSTRTLVDTPYGKGVRIKRLSGNGDWQLSREIGKTKLNIGDTYTFSVKYKVLKTSPNHPKPFSLGAWVQIDGNFRPSVANTIEELGDGWYLLHGQLYISQDNPTFSNFAFGINSMREGSEVIFTNMRCERQSYTLKNNYTGTKNKSDITINEIPKSLTSGQYTVSSSKRNIEDSNFNNHMITKTNDTFEYFLNGTKTREFENKWKINYVKGLWQCSADYGTDRIVSGTHYDINYYSNIISSKYVEYNDTVVLNYKGNMNSIVGRTFIYAKSAVTCQQKFTMDNHGKLRINGGEFIDLGTWDVSINNVLDIPLVVGWNCIELIGTDADTGGSFKMIPNFKVFNEYSEVLYCTAELPFDIINNTFRTSEFTNAIYRDLKLYDLAVKPKISKSGIKNYFGNTNNISLETENMVEGIASLVPKDAYYLPLDKQNEDGTLDNTYSIRNTVNDKLIFENGSLYTGFPGVSISIPTMEGSTGVNIRQLDRNSDIFNGWTIYSDKTNTYAQPKPAFIKCNMANYAKGVGITFMMRTNNWRNSTVAIYIDGKQSNTNKYLEVNTSGNWTKYQYYTDIAITSTDKLTLAIRCKSGAHIEVANIRIGENIAEMPTKVDNRHRLSLNLHNDIGFDWSKDYTIAYFRKPLITGGSHGRTYYSLDSIGCNVNTKGGSYLWWGKKIDDDSIEESNKELLKDEYFNNWRLIVVKYNNSTFRITEYELSSGKEYNRTKSLHVGTANSMDTQHGYDILFSGFDNTVFGSSYLKDMIILKRLITDDEVNRILNYSMRIQKNKTVVANSINEGSIGRYIPEPTVGLLYDGMKPIKPKDMAYDKGCSINGIENDMFYIERDPSGNGISPKFNHHPVFTSEDINITFWYKHKVGSIPSGSTNVAQQIISKRRQILNNEGNPVQGGFEMQINSYDNGNETLHLYIGHSVSITYNLTLKSGYNFFSIRISGTSLRLQINDTISNYNMQYKLMQVEEKLFLLADISGGEQCWGRLSNFRYYNYPLPQEVIDRIYKLKE